MVPAAPGDLNVIFGLQIEQKLRRCARELGEPKRSIGGTGLSAGDLLDSGSRHAADAGKRPNIFSGIRNSIPQSLTGMHGLEPLGDGIF
jgi:hypothetical protein